MLAALAQKLRAAPSQCEVCRAWHAGAMCAACLARFSAATPRCARCGLRMGLAAAACGECLRSPPPFDRSCCVADYGFPWDSLIAAFKFEGRAELATTLAQRMVGAIQQQGPGDVALVLPVPLSGARLAERGYNQAWELAWRLARALQLPARSDVLLRPLETAHQAELGRAARQRNLRRAFMVEPRLRSVLAGRRVALVDDVMTTGATAHAASSALLRAGAAAVSVWVLARTPETLHEAG